MHSPCSIWFFRFASLFETDGVPLSLSEVEVGSVKGFFSSSFFSFFSCSAPSSCHFYTSSPSSGSCLFLLFLSIVLLHASLPSPPLLHPHPLFLHILLLRHLLLLLPLLLFFLLLFYSFAFPSPSAFLSLLLLKCKALS